MHDWYNLKLHHVKYNSVTRVSYKPLYMDVNKSLNIILENNYSQTVHSFHVPLILSR